ncbi:MAG TPA: hypothetical protein DCS63_05385 [Elusimicrobia bacterium]|nr:hypothetical protein [Elusimicrobiota bacterium]
MEQKKTSAQGDYQFKPYIDSEKTIPEFTVQAVILGFILSIVFNGANAYLGLKWDRILRLRNPAEGSFAFEAALSTALYLGVALALYLVARKKHRKTV